MRGGRTMMIFLMLLAATAACTTAPGRPPAAAARPIPWRAAPLPEPGGGASATVRDLVRCGAGLLAVGAVRLAADPSTAPNEQPPPSFRPAAWRWDGSWHALRLTPLTYYGERAVLRSAACRDDEVVAVGSASGGAHGNPRVTTWHAGADGVLAENPNSDFQLFGGPEAVDVGAVAAGGPGFVIAGDWLDRAKRPGPVVWLSADGHRWRRQPDNPDLGSTATRTWQATSLTARTGPGGPAELLLSGAQQVGLTVTPLLLTSTDGVRWQRAELAGTGSLQRVAGGGDELLALGVRTTPAGEAAIVWRRSPTVGETGNPSWAEVGTFGLDQGPRPAQLGGAAQVGPTTLVAGCGGATCGLWRGEEHGTRWTALDPPVALAARADGTVRIAATERLVAVLYDDGRGARIFVTDAPL